MATPADDSAAVPSSFPKAPVSGVKGCARCGDNHEGLAWKAFVHPVEVPELKWVWRWWAPCPVNGDPILLRVEEDASEAPASVLGTR